VSDNPVAEPPGVAAERQGFMATGEANVKVVIETNLGTIKADIWADKSPGTAANFLKYADDRFFDGLIFHRVIDGFMIQGGGFTSDMRQKRATYPAIKNEARSDVQNMRGTLAMARTSVVDSATCQFFINLVDNGFLDHRAKTDAAYGYCVFGKVTEGMEVVDAVAKVQTGVVAGMKDVPLKPVVIKSISREAAAPAN
jgi:cyclophilin family peptidyl-prolyl cis-trans isomerase